jgi:replicative DNA helicase
VLLDNHVFDNVADMLEAGDFHWPAHGTIYRAIRDLRANGQPADLVTLTERLAQTGELEITGGASFLASLVDAVPTAANASYHAKIVREKSVLRQLIREATGIATLGYEGGDDIQGIVNEAESRIFRIGEQGIRKSMQPIKGIIKETLHEIEELYNKPEHVTGLATGFQYVDELTSGLQKSDLIIIAGRPSMGKTSFALNIAQHAAVEQGKTVAVFSLEMASNQLVQRMLCSEARIDSKRVRTGHLRRDDFSKLVLACGRLSEAPIYIDDSGSATVLEIRTKARRLKRERGDLSLVVVDYLQLMRGHQETDNRTQEVSDISRGLKALAKELSVPVVALSQLSRAVEQRGGKDRRPVLADLRESGAIEQDADLVAFIYRDEVYDENTLDKGKAEILIRKHRNGPQGVVKLAFFGEYTRFENLADGGMVPD